MVVESADNKGKQFDIMAHSGMERGTPVESKTMYMPSQETIVNQSNSSPDAYSPDSSVTRWPSPKIDTSILPSLLNYLRSWIALSLLLPATRVWLDRIGHQCDFWMRFLPLAEKGMV